MRLLKHYLKINERRYVNVADLVRQLESLADLWITATAFLRCGSSKIVHFNNSKAAFANVDKSLFDISFKSQNRFSFIKFTCSAFIHNSSSDFTQCLLNAYKKIKNGIVTFYYGLSTSHSFLIHI